MRSISVVIPTFNQARYLGEAIDSAACYLAEGEMASFAQHALRSVLYDEFNIDYLAAEMRAKVGAKRRCP